MFITRLVKPLLAFAPDEPVADVPTPETTDAPVTDQADVTTPDAPEATPAGTGEPEVPETPDAPSDDESFTDVNADDLPDEVRTRYKQMQADYTQKTQALAERNTELDAIQSFAGDLLADEPNDTQEAVFRTLAERLGYELPDEPETPAEGTTPEAEPEQVPEWAKPILAEREAASTAAAEAAREQELDQAEQAIDSGILDLAKADGYELSEEEQALIFSDVLALPPVNNGPDVKGAYDRYKAAAQAYFDRVVKSKQSPQAPSGAAGSEPVDWKNEEARLAETARVVESVMREQSGL